MAIGCSRGRRLEERLLAVGGAMEHERLGGRVGCGGCCEREVKGRRKRGRRKGILGIFGLLFIL